MSESRETLGSRLGFILLSVGCAVGLGNVWRFPYVTGKYGGGMFVLLYLLFLAILGFPLLLMELSVGRAGRANLIGSITKLSGNKKSWVIPAKIAFTGNVLLMIYYTTIAGWLLAYSGYYISGNSGIVASADAANCFNALITDPVASCSYMAAVVILASCICSTGLQKGVELCVKWMMALLFVLICFLAAYAMTMPGIKEGLRFYLMPDLDKFSNNIGETLFAAMGQAFFTLSIGIGSMTIFGSYTGKKRKLTGEAATIIALDTLIALLAGLIIFPICFSFNVAPDSGPGLIFVSLPNIFKSIAHGRLWGALLFVFLMLAALTTVIAVFENIISFMIDQWHFKRRNASLLTCVSIMLLSLPCALGFNILSFIKPMGKNSTILDLEDFIMSQNLLPLGSLLLALFCTCKFGWGWKNFTSEVNTGSGANFPDSAKWYCKWILPLLITAVFILGYKQLFF